MPDPKQNGTVFGRHICVCTAVAPTLRTNPDDAQLSRVFHNVVRAEELREREREPRLMCPAWYYGEGMYVTVAIEQKGERSSWAVSLRAGVYNFCAFLDCPNQHNGIILLVMPLICLFPYFSLTEYSVFVFMLRTELSKTCHQDFS